jgi:hypothetical protein
MQQLFELQLNPPFCRSFSDQFLAENFLGREQEVPTTLAEKFLGLVFLIIITSASFSFFDRSPLSCVE